MISEKKYNINTLESLNEVAKQLLLDFKDEKIFVFDAEMGAGKTTVIKALCNVLEVESMMSSPSFSIINEYITKKQSLIYHFDFYRLQKMQEAVEIGVLEYFYSNSFCFIEWPNIIQKLLPEQYVQVIINWDLETQNRTLFAKNNKKNS